MNSSFIDQPGIWHPYANLYDQVPPLKVKSAQGTRLTLESGESLIDAMSSWWSVIHGYNHPQLNEAAKTQIDEFAHVMFGGLSHRPAEQLCEQLVTMAPPGLDTVFLADTGSVAVEVALKMAVQYWQGVGEPQKRKFISLRGGYHGDTRAAMSVSDPEGGMHQLFTGIICEQHFLDRPPPGFDRPPTESEIAQLDESLQAHAGECAAVIDTRLTTLFLFHETPFDGQTEPRLRGTRLGV